MNENIKDIEQLTGAQRLERMLNRFLSKHLKVALVALAVIVVGLIGLGIGTSVSRKQAQAQFNQIDQLQTQYQELAYLDTEDSSYQQQYDALISELKALADKSKKYPGQKAIYLLGLAAYEHDDFQAALDYFVKSAEAAKQTYLGSLSLANAAASAENLDNDTLALEYWTKIIDEYGFGAAESPKALFGQARLQLKAGYADLAKATFQQLADQFPTSEFSKLAANSLATL